MLLQDGEVALEVGRAVQSGIPRDLATALERLAGEGEFADAGLFPEVNPKHYTRRLIWADPGGAFIVLGCTWAPRQGCDLHDHAGFWGAELVLSGTMEETVFELKEHAGDRFRFERGSTREGRAGSAGIIVPPREFHEFGNPGDEVAHTVHVYSGNLTQCRLYHSDESGAWWRANGVNLCYD